MSVDLKAQRLFSLSGEELLCKQFHLDTSAHNMDIKAISSFSFEDFRGVETINLRFPPVISSKKCEVDTKVIFWLKKCGVLKKCYFSGLNLPSACLFLEQFGVKQPTGGLTQWRW